MWILYFSGKPQSISFNNEHKWEHLGPEFVMLIFHEYSSDQKIYLILRCKYSMVLQCFPRRQVWKTFSVCFSFTSVFQPHNQFLKLQVSISEVQLSRPRYPISVLSLALCSLHCSDCCVLSPTGVKFSWAAPPWGRGVHTLPSLK